MRQSFAGFIIALFVSVSAVAAESSAPSPAIKFNGSRVEVTGITPGGSVVIYGTAMLYVNYGDMLHRYQKVVVDDAREGTVSWDIGRPIPPRGVWIAVYTASRETAEGAPCHAFPPAHPQPPPLRPRTA